MNNSRSTARVILSLMLAIILTGAVAVTAFGAEKKASLDNEYGQIIPTDSKLEAPKSSYSFTGDSTILYFMSISTGAENAHFAIEIFADKNYSQQLLWTTRPYGDEGHKDFKIKWDFKKTPSGTYYGKCYTYVSGDDGNDTIDTDSVRKFKITIDRLSKKKVQLTNISNTQTGVKITWNPIPTAKTYKVYRKADGETKWTNITDLPSNSSSYTDKTVKSGKKYTYSVRAFDGKYKTIPNLKGLSITALSAPKLKSVSATTSNGYAKLTWDKVPGATGYYIYRKGGKLNNSQWEKIATIKSGKTVSYVDKKATSTSWCYTYTVKAYNKTTVSAYDKTGLSFNYLKAPTLKSTSITASGIKITWSYSDSDATHYWVYRKSGDSWVKLGKATGKSFTDTTAKSGKTYTYTVKAASKTNVGAYNTKGISSKFLSVPKLTGFTFDSSKRAKITWEKVSGATGYQIFRKTATNKDWVKIAETTSGKTTTYYDSVKKTPGEKYIYTVRAINGKYRSYYVTSGIQRVFLTTPTIKLANAATDTEDLGIKVSWNKIKNATYYKVYRKAPGATSYKTIASKVTTTSFYDTNVESGKAYSYRVEAFCTNGQSRTNTVSITAVQAPTLTGTAATADGVTITWNAVDGAESYYIYRKTPTGKWSVIGSYALNTYTDDSPEALTGKYYYTVSAESNGFKSGYNTKGIAAFASITDFTAQLTVNEETGYPCIALNWAYDDICESVEIIRTVNGEDETSLGIFTKENLENEYIDYNIEMGNTYAYTAKAIAETKVSTEMSASVEYPYPPIDAVEVNAESFYSPEDFYITVSWSLNDLAENYEVYRRSSKDDKWEKIASFTAEEVSLSGAVYKDDTVDTETDYYYTVKAVRADRDSLYNEEGAYVKILLPLEPVTGIIAKYSSRIEVLEDGKDTETYGAKIEWEKTAFAETYYVLRKTADTDWVELAQITADGEMNYFDTTIEQGVEYIYTIKVVAEGRPDAINTEGVTFIFPLPEDNEPETPEVNDPVTPEGTDSEKPEGNESKTPEGENNI